MTRASEFWSRHPGLVWSNPEADDSIRIRAALLRPRFQQLLDIAGEFGVDRLKRAWAVLAAEVDESIDRARPSVERILNHIELGFARADAGS